MNCRCAVPDWRETIFGTHICMRCGTIRRRVSKQTRDSYHLSDREVPTEHVRSPAVQEYLNRPDREFTDDLGRRWEWCGGQAGTWAWRITGNSERE